jgi:capsular exopolysaccharide synthesis family protein
VRTSYAARAKDLENQAKNGFPGQTNYSKAVNADRVQRLRNLAQFAQPVIVAVRARPPGTPTSPKPIRNGILGLLAGITIALLVAFLRDGLDRRFRSSRELIEELRLPLLGHVPDDVLGMSVAANGRRALTDSELESFRILRTNIDFLDVDSAATAVVVSSAVPEEGKSTVASALAAAYAATGRKALLVECDLRRPTLAKRLDLKPSPGLADFLVGDATPQEILQTVTLPDAPTKKGDVADADRPAGTFVCITAGTPTRRPAELLASVRFETFLAEVQEAYDVVVVDTAPMLSIVDTLEIIPHAGRVVVCVRASKTTREQARAARAALSHFPDRPCGVVITGVRPGESEEYGYYSYAYQS